MLVESTFPLPLVAESDNTPETLEQSDVLFNEFVDSDTFDALPEQSLGALSLELAELSIDNSASDTDTQEIENTRTILTEYQNDLVLKNVKLVNFIARKYHCPAMTLEDLRQEGFIGLTKAALRFDPNQGNEFSTYAYVYINGTIKNAVRDRGSILRGPRENPELSRNYHVAIQILETMHIEITDEAIVKESGLSQADIEEVRLIEQSRVTVTGMDAVVGKNFENFDTNDFLPDASHQSEVAENTVNKITIANAVEQLPSDDLKAIIKQKYNLPPYTQKIAQHEIATSLGISRSSLIRLEKKALAFLKEKISD